MHTTMAGADIESRATQASLRAMGDFTRMTPFERRYVRQVFPFYSWMRHQTLAAMRLPLTSPTRAAWLWHLTNLMNDEDFSSEVLERLGTRIPIGGGRYLNIGGLNPFGDPRNLPLDPTSPNQFASGAAPILDVGAKTIFGFDLGRMGPVNRPYEDRTTDAFGRAQPLSPIRRMLKDPGAGLGEVAYQISGELPQTRGIRELMLGPGQARYGSGDDVAGTKYDRDVPTLNVLLQMANLPRVETAEQMNLEQLMRRSRRIP